MRNAIVADSVASVISVLEALNPNTETTPTLSG